MTFDQLVTEILTRLNLSSAEATARVGRELNTRYKRVTTSINIDTSRRTQVQANVTLGIQTLTFTGIEKVIAIIDKSSGSDVILDELSVNELKLQPVVAGNPTAFAVYRMGANSVTILMNMVPQVALTLFADGYELASTLSGSQEPAFPESFHDILIEGVVADELKKSEKGPIANEAETQYERRLSDLRYFRTSSAFRNIHQGKTRSNLKGIGVTQGGGGSSVGGGTSYTQTGLITFDRDPLAPFAVTVGSATVPNLDADFLDGHDSTYFAIAVSLNASNLTSGTVPDARFPATLPAVSGLNLTALNASNLGSGTVPTARLGSGSALSTTFLAGDSTWKVVSGSDFIANQVFS